MTTYEFSGLRVHMCGDYKYVILECSRCIPGELRSCICLQMSQYIKFVKQVTRLKNNYQRLLDEYGRVGAVEIYGPVLTTRLWQDVHSRGWFILEVRQAREEGLVCFIKMADKVEQDDTDEDEEECAHPYFNIHYDFRIDPLVDDFVATLPSFARNGGLEE